VRNLSDAVLLSDGETLFITDTTADSGGMCGIHVMRRAGQAAPPAADSLPMLAAAMTPATGGAPPGMEPAPTASGTLAGVGGLNWRKDASAAFDEAKRTGKPVLLYARAATSKRCDEAEKGVLASPDFAAEAAPYIAVWFDITTDPKLSQQLGIFRVPTVSVYKPSGDRLGMLQGRMTPDEVLAQVRAGVQAK
jgi:protein disulfide-isomerase